MRYIRFKIIIMTLLHLWMIVAIYDDCRADEGLHWSPLKNLLATENLLAMNYWYLNDESFLCMIVSSAGKKDENPSSPRKLKIFKEVNSTLVKTFEFGANESFDTMSFINDHLYTEWVTGSALYIRIFSLVGEEEIKITLERGTKLTPEIVDIDNDGSEELLITNGQFLVDLEENSVIQYPDTTDIYKWNGETYQLLKTVPWESRFKTR